MDGILFLWLIWGYWIYATFLLSKSHPYRFLSSFVCLLLICVFPYGIKIGSLEVSATVFVFALICILYIRNLSLREKLYMLVVVLTMGMFYAGIGLVAIYDPVLVFIDQNLIISLSFVMMSILFYGHSSHFMLRLLSIVGSSIIGEFLLGIPLNKIGFVYFLGGPVYLDILAISFGGIIVLKTLGEMNQVFNIKALTNKGEMKNL